MSNPSRRTSGGRKRWRPSKKGSVRNTSRRKTFSPQPVSRAEVPRTALITRLAELRGDPFQVRALPLQALAGDEAEVWSASLKRLDQSGQEGRVVLPIAVERRYHAPARRHDAASNRHRLSARALVRQLAEPRVIPHQAGQLARRRVGGAIVHADDLEAPTPGEHLRDLADERCDIACLVAYRNHHRNDWVARFVCHRVDTYKIRLDGRDDCCRSHFMPKSGA